MDWLKVGVTVGKGCKVVDWLKLGVSVGKGFKSVLAEGRGYCWKGGVRLWTG